MFKWLFALFKEKKYPPLPEGYEIVQSGSYWRLNFHNELAGTCDRSPVFSDGWRATSKKHADVLRMCGYRMSRR